MATRGEFISIHMPKKSLVKNWQYECQLLASVMLPLGGTVCMYVILDCMCVVVFYLIGVRVIVVVLLLNCITHCQPSVLIGQLTL